MNWVKWQSISSDFLDGLLDSATRKEAEGYLASDPQERARQERYRKIVGTLKAQPKVALPKALRAAPLSFQPPRLDSRSAGARSSRWERAPWLVRTSVEGVGIAFAILVVVAAVPRLRVLYEKSIERRLDSFSLADFIGGSGGDAVTETQLPLARGKSNPGLTEATLAANEDDFASEDDGEEEDEAPARPEREVRVGNSEVWRFNLKTDSPHDIRPRVVQLLQELKIPANTPGISGIEAPGGIQFDLIVSQAAVPGLKSHLQRIAGASARQTANRTGMTASELQEAFTWYKVKSRRNIPPGKSRVVIWLSQI